MRCAAPACQAPRPGQATPPVDNAARTWIQAAVGQIGNGAIDQDARFWTEPVACGDGDDDWAASGTGSTVLHRHGRSMPLNAPGSAPETRYEICLCGPQKHDLPSLALALCFRLDPSSGLRNEECGSDQAHGP
jgi:hypothetical protein